MDESVYKNKVDYVQMIFQGTEQSCCFQYDRASGNCGELGQLIGLWRSRLSCFSQALVMESASPKHYAISCDDFSANVYCRRERENKCL